MEKIGILSSRFMPMHMGHVYAITKAACFVDTLYVVLTHQKEVDQALCDEDNFKYIEPAIRLRWIRQLTKDMINVRVLSIEGEDEAVIMEAVKDQVKKPITTIVTVTADEKRKFEQYCQDAEVLLIEKERYHYPIGEAQIRRVGIYKHWSYIPKLVRPYFIRKVVIVGTESCGKTTLTNYLAKIYNTTYVEEYGRLICEELGGYEEIFTRDLFAHIAHGHKMLEHEAFKKANKVVFVDTEAIVTQYFSYLYDGVLDPVVEEVAKTQHYDLWLFLEPDVAWIDDGLRVYGEEHIRKENSMLLQKMLTERGISFNKISGTYRERLLKAIALVDELLER